MNLIYKDELIKLTNEGYTTREMAEYFGKSMRTIQYWLKELNIKTKIKLEGKEPLKSKRKKREIRLENKEENLKYNYALYRFLDIKGEVLYLGKCTRSKKNKYGHRYFLQERIQIHFSKSKVMPTSVLNSIYKMEYCFFEENIEELELNLILYYKYRKECIWNGQMIYDFTMTIPKIEWKEFEDFKKIRRFL